MEHLLCFQSRLKYGIMFWSEEGKSVKDISATEKGDSINYWYTKT
jgi:hypothetical protein